jgi:putative membrane protein
MRLAVTRKGTKPMKTALMTVTMITIAMTLALRAQQQSPGDGAGAASDAAFVTKIAQVGTAEVELGNLALQKTQRDDVKKFARRMVDDHTKAGDELKALAMRKNITWPGDLDAEHTSLRDRLSKLSRAAFDQAYMQAMVDGHRKVAAEFRAEAESGADADVKDWAAMTLPAIEAHLEHAESVSRSVHPPGTTQ